MACVAASATVFALVASASDGQQPYKATEFVVSAGPGPQYGPSVSGDWVVWMHDWAGEVRARSFQDPAEIVLGYTTDKPDIWGDLVVWVDQGALYSYDLASQQRSTLGASNNTKGEPRVSDSAVVWRDQQIRAYDLEAKTEITVADAQRIIGAPDVWGRMVVWSESSPQNAMAGDVYLYDLNARTRTRLSVQTDPRITPAAISGTKVVWGTMRNDGWHLLVKDLAHGGITDIATVQDSIDRLDIDGDIVVWSGVGGLMGYDLAKTQRFVVSRAVGGKLSPRISGRRVIWTDTRNSGAGKYEGD